MKPLRNDPCPCGSGVKYKKCCSKKDYAFRDMQKYFQDNKDKPSGYGLTINVPYEQTYYYHAKHLFENMNNSNTKRDDKIILVIMCHLSLEAFINRIGIEIIPNFKSKYPEGFDLEESLKFDSFLEKFEQYPRIVSDKTFDKTQKLWYQLNLLNTFRNQLVHARPKTINFLEGEKNHAFLSNDDVLKKLFNTVKDVVEYLLLELKIPHFPKDKYTRVNNYTSEDFIKPPIGSVITNFQ